MKKKRHISELDVHILATQNNTIVSFTDQQGNLIAWSSAGVSGFKGSRKATPFAAQLAAQDAIKKLRGSGDINPKDITVYVYIKGPGARESAIRAVHGEGFNIKGIIDATPLPHNGCRPRKRRRA